MEIRLPSLHPGQIHVLENRKRFNWLMAGRRWRKTSLCLDVAMRAVLSGQRVIWGAPIYATARIGWDELKYAAGGVFKFNETRGEVLSPTGGVLYFRSLDSVDSTRGLSADGVVLDEVADVKEGAWNAVLYPMLCDTGGWLFAIGTPRGRNWVFKEWAKEADDTASWQIPTLGCRIEAGELIREKHPLENPHFGWEELKRYYERNPLRTFQQEFMADFTEDQSSVFRGIKQCIGATPQDRALPLHSYVAGVDWGKLNDFTVLTVIDALTNEQVHLERFRQISYETQLNRLLDLHNRFRPRVIVCEANSMGEPLCDLLEGKNLPIERFVTTQSSKAKMVDALALALERGELRLLDDEPLINELLAFEMTRLPSGKFRYSAPPGCHDDMVISLCLAYSAMAEEHKTASWYGTNPLASYRG